MPDRRRQKRGSAAERERHALVVVTRRGKILYADAQAQDWMGRSFHAPGAGDMLPSTICRWLARRGGRAMKKALIARQGEASLIVRRHRPDRSAAISLLLELVKEKAGGRTRRDGRLTQRENEVMQWVEAGKTDRDVAQLLGVSPGTVSKHLQRIYVKLGVENRTEAASAYRAAVGDEEGLG